MGYHDAVLENPNILFFSPIFSKERKLKTGYTGFFRKNQARKSSGM